LSRVRDDPVRRAATRAARLPIGAACAVCGRMAALVPSRNGPPILCQDHDRQRRGVSDRDIGHVARRRSFGSLTVLMPASANERIEDMRRDLGLADTPDPLGDPLLVHADYLEGRALIDLLFADHLRQLEAHLRTTFGDRYFEGGPEAPIV
jgi:hypothetical protein